MPFLHEVTKPNAVVVKDGIPQRFNVGDTVVRETKKPICGNRSKVLGACNASGALLKVATPKAKADSK
jgi:hypothetical protein